MIGDAEYRRVIEIGEKNQDVLPLIHNWCGHARVVVEGGVGLVEQTTGLPIAMRRVTCVYERARGNTSMHLAENAIDFHDRNCVGCVHRMPVRLPNLTELLRLRDEETTREEAVRRSRDVVERAETERRGARRESFKKNAPHDVVGVLELLDTLDRLPSEAAGRVLVESARAVPDAFKAEVRDFVIAVGEAGGDERTEAALGALEVLGDDTTSLVAVALRALARGDAVETAARIVAEHLTSAVNGAGGPAIVPLIATAAPNLVWLARPEPPMFYREGRPARPEGLIVAHGVAPNPTQVAIRRALRHEEKEIRRAGAYSVMALLRVGESEAALRFVGDLIAAFTLPDDYHEGGEASHTVAWVLAECIKLRPDATDRALKAAADQGGEAERRGAFRAYAAVFDARDAQGMRAFGEPAREESTAAERVAFESILGSIARLPADDDLLQKGSTFLGHMDAVPWDLQRSAVPALLGTVALASDELARPETLGTLADPRPLELKVWERMARRSLVSGIIRTAMESVVRVATSHPAREVREETAAAILETLDRLPETVEQLRAELVSYLGALGDRPSGVALVLPSVYRAFTDGSQRVRAAGGKAYAELVRRAGADNLPSLVHETFLVLLSDPYIIVHGSALRALNEVRLPDAFVEEAAQRVEHAVAAHADGEHSETLTLALKVWLRLLWRSKRLTPQQRAIAVQLLRKLKTYEADDFVRHDAYGLRGAAGYGEFVIDLLANPATFDTAYEDLIQELRELPPSEIQRLGGRVVDAAMVLSGLEAWRAAECLELLADAEAWDAARALARRRVEACGSTRDLYPRRLRAELDETMVRLEAAAAVGMVDEVADHAAHARALQGDIARDHEEHKEIRGIFAPVRIAPAGG